MTTVTPEADALRYGTELDLTTDNSRRAVVELVGEGRRVLELGCATGYMSRAFRDRRCSVVGIELDPEAAGLAEGACERVIVGDLDTLDLDAELGEDGFDVVVAADVLEHLKDPVRVLRGVAPRIREGGCVVASVPNVAHGSVRLALLQGRFPYSRVGLLDETHLRFFTRTGVLQLFDDAGYLVTNLRSLRRPIADSEVPFDAGAVPPSVVRALEDDPEATTYQFVVAAVPLGTDLPPRAAAMLAAAAREAGAARAEIDRLERTLDEHHAELSRVLDQLRAAGERNSSLHEDLRGAQEQIEKRDKLLDKLSYDWYERERVHDEERRRYEAVLATRVWRMATLWYRWRRRLGRS